jgi:hypothetical protein
VIRAVVVIGCCFAPAVAQMVSENKAERILRDELEHPLDAAGPLVPPPAPAAANAALPLAPPGPCEPSLEPDHLADCPNPACYEDGSRLTAHGVEKAHGSRACPPEPRTK